MGSCGHEIILLLLNSNFLVVDVGWSSYFFENKRIEVVIWLKSLVDL